ncbi:hypothetical protein M5X02_30730 [Paenibacillus alvei]|nr:hypothetical protein [Paenibacillus alvei]EJW13955.1 hypothetical protein PAV_141p00610 [Paenibacillus alvei DSM 29]MCY9545003.1 hypothetical protein [Paenibacillus alvei]MEC0082805.1 hypothetical protein [Paenibacillus alvei]
MKAFRVRYNTGDMDNEMIVLAQSEEHIEEALANKEDEFYVDDEWSKIIRKREVPLSNVMVSDLSVTELSKLQRWMEINKEKEKPVQMEWEEFAWIMEKVSTLVERGDGWAFQFLDSSIFVYKGDNIIRFCDNIQEFADFIQSVCSAS